MVKKKGPRREVRKPISTRRLGRMLLDVGRSTGCPLCLKHGQYYLRFTYRRRMHKAYRHRRRYW
jgi:hypothetical protein